ncbi:MAG: hypothetical protein M3450_06745, partial [Actinomycetota bacterium]|nr:hypothetical protein [Actinomycetota bacterium]
ASPGRRLNDQLDQRRGSTDRAQSEIGGSRFSGTGLAPGASITTGHGEDTRPIGVVSANGTYSAVFPVEKGSGSYNFTAPKAAGGTILVTATSTC